jgi:hypothetical protein
MLKINQVPASAGAQWLLDGLVLFRRAPLALARVSVLGFSLALLATLLGSLMMQLTAGVPFPLSLLPLALYCVLALGVPSFVFAGILWAVREVQQGRPALPRHLLKGFASRRMRALLVTALPQFVAVVLAALALMALLGTEGVQQILDVLQKLQAMTADGQQPDPVQVQALVAQLPAGRMLLWLLLVVAATPLVICLVMLAIPQIVFSGAHGGTALRASLSANLRNLPAMLLFAVILAVVFFATSLVLQVIGLLIQAVLGPMVAMFVINLVMMGVLMPLVAAAAYHAWHQIFEPAGSGLPPVAPAPAPQDPGTFAA